MDMTECDICLHPFPILQCKEHFCFPMASKYQLLLEIMQIPITYRILCCTQKHVHMKIHVHMPLNFCDNDIWSLGSFVCFKFCLLVVLPVSESSHYFSFYHLSVLAGAEEPKVQSYAE